MNALQCDTCHAVVTLDALTPPAGWLQVVPVGLMMFGSAERPKHVCSWACLGLLAVNAEPVEA